jgi:hypothetical protein
MRRVAAVAAAVLVTAALGRCGDDSDGLSRDELVKACALSSACGVRGYPAISNCVEAYHDNLRRFGLGPMYDGIYRCVVGSGGKCDAVYACWGASRSAPTCGTDFKARCEGSKAHSCDTIAGVEFTLDCSLAGLQCRVRDPASPGAFEADCTVGACEPTTQPRCDGNRLLSCNEGGNLGIEDCGAGGLTCGQGTQGLDCIGAGEEGCNIFDSRCDGNTAVVCTGGRVHRIDCSSHPYATRCDQGACAPAGNECADTFNRCKEDSLEYCLDGRWHTLDCAGLGLGPCAPLPNGADCTPTN